MEGIKKTPLQQGLKDNSAHDIPQSEAPVARISSTGSDDHKSDIASKPVSKRSVSSTTESDPGKSIPEPHKRGFQEGRKHLRHTRQSRSFSPISSDSEPDSHPVHASRSLRRSHSRRERQSKTRSRSPLHRRHDVGSQQSKNVTAARELKKVYEECVDLMKKLHFQEARDRIADFARRHEGWRERPVIWALSQDLTGQEEKKHCTDLSELGDALLFMEKYHKVMEEIDCWGEELPDNFERSGFQWEDLRKGVLFVKAFLLNPVFRSDKDYKEDHKLEAARKHLMWVLKSQRLEVDLHVTWLETYMQLCEHRIESDPEFTESEEGRFYNKSMNVINDMKAKKNLRDAFDVLNDHMSWVREQNYSPYAVLSLACCSHAYNSHFIHGRHLGDRDGSFIKLNEVYYSSARMLALGSRRHKYYHLLKVLPYVGQTKPHLSNFPQIYPKLIYAQFKFKPTPSGREPEFRWNQRQRKEIRQIFAENCCAVLSLDYVDALDMIADKRYRAARKLLRKELERSDLLEEEYDALYLQEAYTYLLEGRRDDAKKCLDDSRFQASTQAQLQALHLYKSMNCKASAKKLLKIVQPKGDPIFMAAYKPILDWLSEDSLSSSSSSSSSLSSSSLSSSSLSPSDSDRKDDARSETSIDTVMETETKAIKVSDVDEQIKDPVSTDQIPTHTQGKLLPEAKAPLITDSGCQTDFVPETELVTRSSQTETLPVPDVSKELKELKHEYKLLRDKYDQRKSEWFIYSQSRKGVMKQQQEANTKLQQELLLMESEKNKVIAQCEQLKVDKEALEEKYLKQIGEIEQGTKDPRLEKEKLLKNVTDLSSRLKQSAQDAESMKEQLLKLNLANSLLKQSVQEFEQDIANLKTQLLGLEQVKKQLNADQEKAITEVELLKQHKQSLESQLEDQKRLTGAERKQLDKVEKSHQDALYQLNLRKVALAEKEQALTDLREEQERTLLEMKREHENKVQNECQKVQDQLQKQVDDWKARVAQQHSQEVSELTERLTNAAEDKSKAVEAEAKRVEEKWKEELEEISDLLFVENSEKVRLNAETQELKNQLERVQKELTFAQETLDYQNFLLGNQELPDVSIQTIAQETQDVQQHYPLERYMSDVGTSRHFSSMSAMTMPQSLSLPPYPSMAMIPTSQQQGYNQSEGYSYSSYPSQPH